MVMLRRVRNTWITDVLEPSLAEVARLTLGLQHRSEVLDLGTRTRHSVGHPPRPLPMGTPISEVFDKAAGGLLILGKPGAGKTTLLLQLADELLDRAEGDTDQPIPVVVNLASWARRRQPLKTWLVEELAMGYTMPERTIRAWVAADALVLLLDGVDEVAEAHRAACAEAINAYRREHGVVPMAVCSRTQELQALAAKPRLDEAVELQPPSDTEIDTYLGQVEATGTPLTDVRAALASDQELRTLLRSPLLLHVVALAYHGPRPVAALQAPGSLQQRQERLWEAYLSRMFEQRPLEPGYGYTPERAVDWLAWLAGRLRDRDQTQLHLDRLDDSWLPTPAQRRLARLAAMLAAGLLVGLLVGLLTEPLNRLAGEENPGLGLGFGLVSGLVAALVWGALAAPPRLKNCTGPRAG